MLLRPRTWLPAGAALAGLGWYMWRVETRRLRITRLLLPVPWLPPAFDGYRIAHLSDLHLGIPLTETHLPVVIEATQRERPDLIVLTGDFATGKRPDPDRRGVSLAGLQAPDGVWAVLGNHDYYFLRPVKTLLQGAGIRLLRNTHAVIARGTDRLVIAGLDDLVRGTPDFAAALDGVPDDCPVILLAHEPDFARLAASNPRIILQLSGHTHGGQVRLPRLGALILPKLGHLFPAGAYRIGQMALYVTTGTGTGRFVFRLNCRPEIAVITLVRGDLHRLDNPGPAWRPDPQRKRIIFEPDEGKKES